MQWAKLALHHVLAFALASLLLASAAQAVELRVVSSGGFAAAYRALLAAAALIAFLVSPAAEEAVTKSGLEPMVAATAR